MRSQILNFLPSLTAVAAVCAPAYAQSAGAGVDQYSVAPNRAQWIPGVRYTTGAYLVNGRGFEKDLVNGNPNLGHWNWSPVIGYHQGMLKTSKQATAAPTPAPQHSIYVKPNHVPLPVVRHDTTALVAKSELLVVPPKQESSGFTNKRAETNTRIILSYGKDNRSVGADYYRSISNVHGVIAHQNVGAALTQPAQY